MFGGQGGLAPKIKVVVAAREDALHRVSGGVTCCGHSCFVTVAAEVVVIAH